MTRYRVTFTLQLYAESNADAVRTAGSLMRIVDARNVRAPDVAWNGAVDERGMTGSMTGEPHGEALEGWHCLTKVEPWE